MNANMLKGVFATASVLLAVGSASSALAQTRPPPAPGVTAFILTPGQTLGDDATATDLWVAVCPPGKTGLFADVLDRTGVNNVRARIGVTIVKDNAAITATSGGEGEISSAELGKGAGAYIVTYHKTDAGVDDYDSVIACQPGFTDPTNLSPPDPIEPTQNQ